MMYDPAIAGVFLGLREGFSLFLQESTHGELSGSSRTLADSCGPWSLAVEVEVEVEFAVEQQL